jgi:DNA-directed RNA polymerase specialized sigma subunit
MSDLVEAFMPTVNAEIMQYSGPKELLRSRGRLYVIQAIKSFNPMGTAKLRSWVVTNLKQLSRYGKRLRPIRASEAMLRNAAELATIEKRLEDDLGRKPTMDELTDETGWNPKTIEQIRKSAVPTVNSGVFDVDDDGGDVEGGDPALIAPSKLPYATEAVYAGLDQKDKDIFDYRTGSHGKSEVSGKELADMLKITPAAVSQRSAAIGSQIVGMAMN